MTARSARVTGAAGVVKAWCPVRGVRRLGVEHRYAVSVGRGASLVQLVGALRPARLGTLATCHSQS